MRISEAIAKAFREQVGHELGNSHQYLALSAYCEGESLFLMAKSYAEQADDEREHALKFVRFLLDSGAPVEIPAVAAPRCAFRSLEEVAALALETEVRTSGQIHRLMETALAENDFAAQAFLQPFVVEQVAEVAAAESQLAVIRRAGPNVLMVEAYLIHTKKGG